MKMRYMKMELEDMMELEAELADEAELKGSSNES